MPVPKSGSHGAAWPDTCPTQIESSARATTATPGGNAIAKLSSCKSGSFGDAKVETAGVNCGNPVGGPDGNKVRFTANEKKGPGRRDDHPGHRVD